MGNPKRKKKRVERDVFKQVQFNTIDMMRYHLKAMEEHYYNLNLCIDLVPKIYESFSDVYSKEKDKREKNILILNYFCVMLLKHYSSFDHELNKFRVTRECFENCLVFMKAMFDESKVKEEKEEVTFDSEWIQKILDFLQSDKFVIIDTNKEEIEIKEEEKDAD